MSKNYTIRVKHFVLSSEDVYYVSAKLKTSFNKFYKEALMKKNKKDMVGRSPNHSILAPANMS